MVWYDMDKQTVRPAPAIKIAERYFSLSGHKIWACGLVTKDGHEPIGVRLKVVLPFGCSPRTYITRNGGQSFQHVSNFFSATGALDLVGNTETAAPMVTVLKRAFATWNKASGQSEQRLFILNTCLALRALFASVPLTDSLTYMQDVGRIQSDCQVVPDESLQDVEDELTALLRQLRARDAGDGEKILSPRRFEKFLSQSCPTELPKWMKVASGFWES